MQNISVFKLVKLKTADTIIEIRIITYADKTLHAIIFNIIQFIENFIIFFSSAIRRNWS